LHKNKFLKYEIKKNKLLFVLKLITLSISLLVIFFINISNDPLLLPYNNVPATIAAGNKISIPISNKKIFISNWAALGNSY